MRLNKDPKDWARVKPDAVAAGSPAQVANVLEMALQDIQRLSLELTTTQLTLRKTEDRFKAAKMRYGQMMDEARRNLRIALTQPSPIQDDQEKEE